jgi:hypothetical protein
VLRARRTGGRERREDSSEVKTVFEALVTAVRLISRIYDLAEKCLWLAS